jgi:hypothetical protein
MKGDDIEVENLLKINLAALIADAVRLVGLWPSFRLVVTSLRGAIDPLLLWENNGGFWNGLFLGDLGVEAEDWSSASSGMGGFAPVLLKPSWVRRSLRDILWPLSIGWNETRKGEVRGMWLIGKII